MKSKTSFLPFALAALLPSLGGELRAQTIAYDWSTFAGSPGVAGSVDGTGPSARFNLPMGITADAAGNLYVAGGGDHVVRKVTPAGVVTTFAGLAGSPGYADGTGAAARFRDPIGLVVDAEGNLVVAEWGNHTLRKITPSGVVTTFAGAAGVSGSADGTGSAARFFAPFSLGIDAAGNLYVADSSNHTVRKVTPAAVVTTLAGTPGVPGSADGTGSAARFENLHAVTADAAGTVYVADIMANTIRRISSSGVVTTIAGSVGQPGSADGTGNAARFSAPWSIAVDSAGVLYVTEQGNNTVRRVTAAGGVTTIGGLAGSRSYANGVGTAARFSWPRGLTVLPNGSIFLVDEYNHVVRKADVLTSPVITTQPARLFAVVGESPTFSVVATGGGLSYQWRKDGVAIPGATNASYPVPAALTAAPGRSRGYDVVVSNAVGSITSSGTDLAVGTAESTGFVYTEAAGQVTIVGYRGSGSAVTVPAILGGNPVVRLDRDTFALSNTVTSVIIPEGVTSLGQGVFFMCPNLTRVEVPSTVTSISLYAFQQCPKLTEIIVAPGNPAFEAAGGILYTKGKGTVLQCSTAVTGNLVLPASVTAIANSAFWGCRLTSLSFPGTVTSLHASAFLALSGLQSVYFGGPPPPVTSPGQFDSFTAATIYYDSRAEGWGTTYGTRPTAAYDFPSITAQPQSRVLTAPGGTVSFSVTAAGGAPLTYQWTRNGQLLTGATQATLLLPNAQAAAVGSYRVTVSNLAASTTSEPATFEILQPGNTAVQLLEGGGYVAGQPLSVTNVLTYSGTASALGWSVLLPPGWTFASSTATDTSAAPLPGQTDLLEWAWATIPPSPVAFTYTVNVPAGQTGPRELVALAGVRNGTSLQFLAQPDPLVVAEVATHNADTDRNYRISLLELTRVIELYNTRNGTSRTGAYAVAAAATEDGFEPAPARLASATVTLARYHSGDSNRDGKLGLLELTRVIELYNYRSGTSRTGQYKVKSGTEDGFDPGP